MTGQHHSSPLVGTAGWERDGWAETYYPADLPTEWRLAYYANDCGCVLLDASDLARMQPGEFAGLMADVGDHLVVLIRIEAGGALAPEWAACFAGLSGRLFVLAPPGVTLDPRLPHWAQVGDRLWREPGGDRCVVCWDIEHFDLRQLKSRVAALPDQTFALLLEGRGASPARAEELQTLLALMGWV